MVPFTAWFCALGPAQSGYPVGVFSVGTSPYTQFRIASNFETSTTDLIFNGY